MKKFHKFVFGVIVLFSFCAYVQGFQRDVHINDSLAIPGNLLGYIDFQTGRIDPNLFIGKDANGGADFF